jgi:glycosyltransferase involved in cell wall biosynthesis
VDILESRTKIKVAVLLPTFNGERFLEEQLNSLLNQEGIDLRVYIRDDASTDRTIEILNKYSGNFVITFSKNNIGTSASLLKLLKQIDDFDYLAFCDQDDVWAANHLSEGVQKLRQVGDDRFALYFPLYNFLDSKSQITGKRKPILNLKYVNALVENPIIGCGIILNKKAADTIKRFDLSSNYFLDHQIYFIGALVGEIIQGSKYTVNYRIHDSNQVGISFGASALLKHLLKYRIKLELIRNQQKTLKNLFLQLVDEIPEEVVNRVKAHFRYTSSSSAMIRSKYFFHPLFKRQKGIDQFIYRLIFIKLFQRR